MLNDYFLPEYATIITKATMSASRTSSLANDVHITTHITDVKIVDDITLFLTTTARVMCETLLFTTEDIIQIGLSKEITAILSSTGDVFWACSSNIDGYHPIKGLKNIAIIAVKDNVILAVRTDGQLFYYGPGVDNVLRSYLMVKDSWLVPQWSNVKSLIDFDIITIDNYYHKFEC